MQRASSPATRWRWTAGWWLSDEVQRQQCANGGHCLHEEDLAVDRERTVDTRHDHAGQEEHLHRNAGRAEADAPGQARREEAVVQALIGRQGLGGGGELL